MKRVRFILAWLIGLTFITTGILKYVNLDEMSKAIFDRANYPKWFFYVVATLEFAGGVLLLMTATASRRLGNMLIGTVMLGAIGTHYILKDNYSHFVVPSIILILSILTSLNFKKREKSE